MAPVAVLEAEFSFEIDAPGVVGLERGGKRLRQRRSVLARFPHAAETPALEEIADRGGARPVDVGMAVDEDRPQFARSAPRHLLAGLDDPVLDLG